MILPERYTFQKDVGRGALGDIILAEDSTTGQTVFIRALDRRLKIEPDVLAVFKRDASVLRALDAPGIIPFLDIFTHEGRLHLVTPYIDGMTLDAYLKKHGPPDEEPFREWAISLASALSQAHNEGILHGDLRSSNVFVVPEPDTNIEQVEFVEDEAYPEIEETPPGETTAQTSHYQIMVSDFGLYRLIEGTRLTTTSAHIDLPSFTSPQRWYGDAPSIDDDVWGVGVLLHTTMSGQPPFAAETDAATMNKILYASTPNLRRVMSRGMVAIVERCLEKAIERRYRSLRGVLADLERGHPRRITRRRRGLMPRRTNPRASWAIFALVLLVLLGIPAGGGAAIVASNAPTATPIEIAGIIIPPTPTVTPTPRIVAFAASPVGPPTETRTPTNTYTPIVVTNTPTLTLPPSETPTTTPTSTITPSPSATATATLTNMPTETATATSTASPTVTASVTASITTTPTASATFTATASPTPTATFTATATPTPTANMTATENFEAFQTRAAVIQETQTALETRLAPTATANMTATTEALGTLSATLDAFRVARTDFSAVPLCSADEEMVAYADFDGQILLDRAIPTGFVEESIGQNGALHLARTANWVLPVPSGYNRIHFDMFVPAASSSPLVVSLVTGAFNAEWNGWRLDWTISSEPNSTGMRLEHIVDGEIESTSPLIELPFNTWVTVELALWPATPEQDAVLFTAYLADGPSVSALPIDNDGAPLFVDSVVIGATVDSAPWLDNLLLCHQLDLATEESS